MPPEADTPLLSVRDLRVTYGHARAVQSIDLDVGATEIVALLGANGAGKSSTLLAVSNLVAHQGEVRFDGEDIFRLTPDAIVRRGVVQVPERRAIFADLTVAEHLTVGRYLRRRDPEAAADLEFVHETFPRLGDLAGRRAGTLSGGEQQMLVLAKALLARPRLLLVDELSLGLAPLVVAELFDVLERIHRRGVAILLVEQFVALALRLADRVYVLEKGRVTAQGPAAGFRQDAGGHLARSYLGGDVRSDV